MSWLCNNCETLNDDNDNICLVCNSVPPSISEISLDCRKSQITWTSSNVNQLTLRYSQGDFNITGLTSTSIDISDVETLVFIAKNDVAERIFPVTLSRSFVQEVLKYKKDDESWIFASRHGTREDLEHYISLYPVIEEGIITTDRNVAIAFDLTAVDTDFEEGDSAILGTIIISVLCTDKVLLLDKNILRHWEIARLIINDIDDFKGSASGKFVVTGADRFINKHYYGCAVKVLVSDDATEVEF